MAEMSEEEALRSGLGIRFTPGQVAALCGGKFPEANGFNWGRVGHFMIEDGVLQPFAGPDILPGPGLKVTIEKVGLEESSHSELSLEFPKFHMIVSGQGQYMTLREAARAHASLFAHVEIGKTVLNADKSTRPITAEEERKIVDLSDDIDANK